MTPEEIEKIKKRCEAATPGPWEYDFYKEYVHTRDSEGDLFIIADVERATQSDSDGYFIAHARQDIPALIEALEASQREAAQANEAVKVLSEGKPLGPIIGSHTILNQALEIKRLRESLESLLSYTLACEGLLNASESGQCKQAKQALARTEKEGK